MSDAQLVRALNRIYYDVEAAQYDERHPEVIEGDADWWSSRTGRLVAELRPAGGAGRGLAILDLGCGTGFVSGLLSRYVGAGDLIVGLDQSEGMLARARAKANGAAGVSCHFQRGDAAQLPLASGRFDMVTVNSFLHHVFDYAAVLREIDRVLRPGGYLLLAHEPNRDFFRSPLMRLAASGWKLIGFGMSVPADLREAINTRLREARLVEQPIGSADILRLVEYHSPIEQSAVGIDRDKGFSPRDLLARELRGYEVLELNQYSTFYHRPLLQRHAWLMRLARRAGDLFNGGNLFSAVLRKPAEAACR